MHSIARMAEVLRGDRDARGLVTANGGYLTKHAFGVYSSQAPTRAFRHEDLQAKVDETPRREVAMADAELAEIPWTSVWYSEALELRVNWRLWVTDARNRKRFGDEAISMIDRVAIMSPTLNLYGLRARAGFSAGRPEVVVESLSNYARLAMGMAKAGVNTPESLRKDAPALRNVLDEVAKLPQADVPRIEEVRAEIAAMTAGPKPN